MHGMASQKGRRTGTVPNVVFARIQRVQKVEEMLNEFKRTRLVSRKVGGRTEWKVRRVESEWDCDCARCCVWEGPEGSES
jgi:hypothetical protein